MKFRELLKPGLKSFGVGGGAHSPRGDDIQQKEPQRTKPLEQRRQELEDYIQDIIYQYEDVPQVLLDFLHVKHFHTGNKISSMESLDELTVRITVFEILGRAAGWPVLLPGPLLLGPRPVLCSFSSHLLSLTAGDDGGDPACLWYYGSDSVVPRHDRHLQKQEYE
ncbi:sorting nexin-24-like protein [Lates japonicus]|uniref:Sorting nexin-24-like protein n=1 Tax=Lates japonicus TaxID=270547 RepID=A0AAD3R8F6_LATJO|nr:sorting nexin-24-like protein [Lates japonicus]